LIVQDELDLLPVVAVPPQYSSYDEPTEEELYYRQTDPELVAVIYRQLATSFEASRNHDLAEACISGMWEMKRRDRSIGRLNGLAVGIYRVASVYGSSFWRALLVLAILVCIVFPSLYAIPSIAVVPTPSAMGIDVKGPDAHAHSVFESRLRHWTSVAKRLRDSVWIHCRRAFLLSVETASFSRNAAYTTESLFGRLLVSLESVLVAGQAALFLLALRRRFRH
jgi:hypothetical protein